jgi:DNA-binding MurR/RpiR family transcriptional regulator
MLFYERIKKHEYKFSDTEDSIVEYILNNKDDVVKLSIKMLADKFYTVPNTIIRLCKKIEYDGFSQLKNNLKEELKESKNDSKTGFELNIKKTLELLDFENINRVVDLIYKSRNIIFYGIGQNEPLCEIVTKELKAKDKNVNYYNQRHEAFNYINKLKEEDLIFIISLSGKTKDVVEASKIASNNGCKIVALTHISENELQKNADINLYCYSSLSKINEYNISDKVPIMIVLRAITEKYWSIY